MTEKVIDLLSLEDYDFSNLNLYGVEKASLILKKGIKTDTIFAYFWGRMSPLETEQACSYVLSQIDGPASLVCEKNVSEKVLIELKETFKLEHITQRQYVLRYLTILNRLSFDTKQIMDLGVKNTSEVRLLLNMSDDVSLVSSVATVGLEKANVSQLLVATSSINSPYRDLFIAFNEDLKEISNRRKNPLQLEITIKYLDDESEADVSIDISNYCFGRVNSIPESHALWLKDQLGYDVLKKDRLFKKLNIFKKKQ